MGRHTGPGEGEDERQPADHEIHTISSRDIWLDVDSLAIQVLDVLLVHDAHVHPDRVSHALPPATEPQEQLQV